MLASPLEHLIDPALYVEPTPQPASFAIKAKPTVDPISTSDSASSSKHTKQPKKGKVSQIAVSTIPASGIINDIASVPASESYSVPCDSIVGFEDDLRLRREHIRDFDKKRPSEEERRRIFPVGHGGAHGHGGVKKTARLLRQAGFIWPGITEDIQIMIKNCPTCQVLFPLSHNAEYVRHDTHSHQPFEALAMDFKVINHTDHMGMSYLLVIVDMFSLWVELFPVPDMTAITACRCLCQVFGRYGAARLIASDQGPAFVSEVFFEFRRMVGFEIRFSLAYHHQANGLVERVNREVDKLLKVFQHDYFIRDSWSDSTPFIQRIINSMKHRDTEVSSAQVIYGNLTNIDRHLFEAPAHDFPVENVSDIPPDYLSTLQSNHGLLIQHLQETYESRAQAHSEQTPISTQTFPPGSYVLSTHPDDEAPDCFSSRRIGPFMVIAQEPGSDIYLLKDLVSNQPTRLHAKRLSPFYSAPGVDHLEVAARSRGEAVIESIIDHRNRSGNTRSMKAYEFLVHWKGFNIAFDSWSPYMEVRLTEQLSIYLSQLEATGRPIRCIPLDTPGRAALKTIHMFDNSPSTVTAPTVPSSVVNTPSSLSTPEQSPSSASKR
jgi:transposase InsO family protein